ncbi:hypothetical protein I7I50_05702 [Histoplasma capsulatum G186AR]|uniref:Uncharacterized protein n=1 Tax=Ajellomyces capsulatus TaxID=5037 RepID=A0A8H7ZCQ5_AJECA|nr:hypothetical protein I7I52_03962 [Histoplasma capsulatum]QSS76299.1 hypothetical protein I7I50_05702 [Histoplasma capsulatum G186AR]
MKAPFHLYPQLFCEHNQQLRIFILAHPTRRALAHQLAMTSSSTPVKLSDTAEMLLISPIIVTPNGQPASTPSPNRKRKITPSSEESSAKRIAVITSPPREHRADTVQRSSVPNPLGWPTSAPQARIDERQTFFTNPRLQRKLSSPEQAPPPPLQHIILPFDLRENPDAFYNEENRNILSSIFPETHGLAMDSMFLIFLQTKVPPKPWPRTIAGVPVCFAPEIGPQYIPRPIGIPAYVKNPSISKDLNGRAMQDWEPLFVSIKTYFQEQGISITEVMYLKSYVVIVLEHRNTDPTKLLSQAANIRCFYYYDDEIGRPASLRACRLTDPTPTNPDNNEYSTLQPGLRVTSDYLPSKPGTFLSTTAGVLVRDAVGNEFMTVAPHGFPDECGLIVNHPLPSGRDIGELIREVAHTDVALVKLRETEKFSNVTFQNSILESIQLKRLASAKGPPEENTIYLDSPDTGCVLGSLLMTSFQRVPIDDSFQPNQQWVFTIWNYMGQDISSTLPERICGSAIWNGDGDVLGFFRYAPKAGVMKDWCAGIAADELINKGYTLVDTTGRQELLKQE